MAPELLNPSGFGLKNSNPTKKSDIYAFGITTYQVSVTHLCKVWQLKTVSRSSQGNNPSLEPKTG